MQIEPSVQDRNPFNAMSKGAKKDMLAKYMMRVKAAKEWRDSEGYDKTWKRLRDYYRLKMASPYDDSDSIVVAIAFATINVIAPSVAINHPKVTVTPRDEEHDDAATIIEAVVNYWWRHNHYRADFRMAVKDYLVYGHGWLKVGWRYTEDERPMEAHEQQAMAVGMQQQAEQYAADVPDAAHLLPTDQQIHENLPDTAIEVTEDAPFCERISPFDVFVDPESTSMLDCKWIAQRLVLPLERVQKDEKYGPNRRKLKSDNSLRWFNENQKAHIPDEAGRVTLWEFYDIEAETLCVFADQQDVGYLVDPQEFTYKYGHPFVMLRNYEVPDQFYPIGEIEAIQPLQDELNETRSAMVGARRLDIAKYMYHEGAVDDQGLDALTSNVPYTAVPIKDEVPLIDAIMAFPRNAANSELYRQHSEVILGDMDRVTGINEYQRGALPEVRRTATEASIIQDAANARASDKLAQVEEFASDVSRHLVQLAQTYMTSEQVAVTIGMDGTKVWTPFTPEDIQGEFLFAVEAGSTQPQNETFRRQQATQMMQMIGPLLGSGFINVPALLTHVLREGFGIKNPEKFVQAPPPQIDPATGMPIADPNAAQGGPPGMDPNAQQPPMDPAQAADPQLSGGPQPPPGPGSPQPGIQGVPPGILSQIQNQFGLLQGAGG